MRRRIDETDAGVRLDRFLAAELDLPRHQIQRWIAAGRVRLGDGRNTKPASLLSAGDVVSWELPTAPADPGLVAEVGELTVLYEDAELIVLDKPAGIAVHPGAGRAGGTLANRLLGRYPELAGVGGAGRPGIIHRLDLDTTGVFAIARTAAAYRALSRAFAERRVAKTYLAVVYGQPPEEGEISLPIGRHRGDRKRMTVRGDGRPALTRYRRRDSEAGVSRLDIDLATGRTHQIRVHFKAIGYPLVGDPTYGEARWRGLPNAVRRPLRDFPRPALHAARLMLRHPVEDRDVDVRAPLPDDLRQLWHDVTGGDWPDEGRP